MKKATSTATRSALTPATRRITATASGRTLTVVDSVSKAEIRMVINKEGGLERELVNAEKHDKQYGNNIAAAVAYAVPHIMNSKAGVAKNLQTLAKMMNNIPAKNIRNLSNRFRSTLNTQYDLVSPYDENYSTCQPEKRGFFHEVTKRG